MKIYRILRSRKVNNKDSWYLRLAEIEFMRAHSYTINDHSWTALVKPVA